MSAIPNLLPPMPEDNGELPLSPEMIGHLMGVEIPKRLLSKQQVDTLNRRGGDIVEGYLIIKISAGRVVAIGDVRFVVGVVERSARLLSNRHLKTLNRRGRDIHEGYLIIKISASNVAGIGDARFAVFA